MQENRDDETGKMFVGGLSWETTKESLADYFSKFGEIVDSVVMRNNETSRSRGFGFVTFKDPSSIQGVLNAPNHMLDTRTIDPKPCNPRSMQQKKGNNCKIFLGGLPLSVSETDLKTFFSKYGKVTDVMIMYDQDKKARGFGFLTFESEEAVDRVCDDHYVHIKNKQIECRRAEKRTGGGGGGGNGGGYGMSNSNMQQSVSGGQWGHSNGMNAPAQSSYQQSGWGNQEGSYGSQGGSGGYNQSYGQNWNQPSNSYSYGAQQYGQQQQYGSYGSPGGAYPSGNYQTSGSNYGYSNYGVPQGGGAPQGGPPSQPGYNQPGAVSGQNTTKQDYGYGSGWLQSESDG